MYKEQNLSRQLNYGKVFNDLISKLRDYATRRIDDFNYLNKLYVELENDYSILKCGKPDKQFEQITEIKAVLGVSGGMDSTIVNLLASLAFGVKNLYTFSLPTVYNSHETRTAAEKLPSLLKNNFGEISISIEDDDGENEQALRRALILQKARNSLASKHKDSFVLILNTSNLSEIKLANYTINGDTIGDIGCLKNLYKSEIYELVDWMTDEEGGNYLKREYSQIENWNDILNCMKDVAQIRPSAELKNNQTDSDVLLKGDYYYVLADMILIAKDEGLNDDEICNQLIGEESFIDWANEFFEKINLNHVAKYCVNKINYRLSLGQYKINKDI